MARHVSLVALLTALAASGSAPALAQAAPNPSFHLVNRSQELINEVYATPKGRPNWGRDRLGDRSLPPGQSFPVRLPADGSCAYDIRVVYASGKSEEQRDFNTCEVETVAFPRSSNRATRGAWTPSNLSSRLAILLLARNREAHAAEASRDMAESARPDGAG